MKVISISKKKFESLKPLDIPKNIINTEAKIFEFNYKGQNKIFKKLYINNGANFANKLYTLEMLDQNKDYLPNSFLIPDYLVSILGEVKGFTTPKIEGIPLSTFLLTNKSDYGEDIFYLRKIGEILIQLENIRKYTPLKQIYINDLHESNFIINNNRKELHVIDLDSCKISHNKTFPSKLLITNELIRTCPNKYEIVKDGIITEHIKINRNTDLYCYTIIILNYLYGSNISNMSIVEFYNYLNYLNKIGVDKTLTDIFNNLLTPKDNINPVNYLDTLTNEQIVRAKEYVYRKTYKNI